MTAESPVRTLWRALIRFDRNRIVPEVAVRNTIGFTLAVALGAVLASPSVGVVAGLGALNVSYTDGRDPYALRARRMLISALLSGVAVALGAVSGHSNLAAVAVAAAWAFAAGMLVALGTTATDLGVITLVTLVVFAAKPLPPARAIETAGVAVGGGLLQALIATFLWPVRRFEPERRILAEVYRDLAGISRNSLTPAAAPPMTGEISDAQAALAPLARDHGLEAERHVFLLAQAERIRLSILNLGRLRRRLARHEGGALPAGALERMLGHAAGALHAIGLRVLSRDAATAPPVPLAPLSASLDEFRDSAAQARSALSGAAGLAFFRALLRDADQQADALRSQISAAAGAASGSAARPYPAGSPARDSPGREPWRLHFQGWRARLEANLSLDSTVFRHAVRLALCLALGDAIGRGLGLQRSYWIPMTIAIVLKPDFTATFARGLLRIGGTLAGLVIATVLFRCVHAGVAGDIALMAVFVLLLRWVGPANYGIFVMAVSGLVVLLIAVTGTAPADVIAARALNTSIGGTLALLAWAAWPTWEKTQTSAALALMLDSYRDYFLAVIAACEGAPASAIGPLRLKARRARTNAVASVDRMSGEPGVTPRQIAALNAILVHSHSFVYAAMAMEARLYRSRRDPAPPWLPGFAASAARALSAMAADLRSPSGTARRPRLGDVESHVPPAESGTLPGIEADRVRTSLRSLREEIAKRDWL